VFVYGPVGNGNRCFFSISTLDLERLWAATAAMKRFTAFEHIASIRLISARDAGRLPVSYPPKPSISRPCWPNLASAYYRCVGSLLFSIRRDFFTYCRSSEAVVIGNHIRFSEHFLRPRPAGGFNAFPFILKHARRIATLVAKMMQKRRASSSAD